MLFLSKYRYFDTYRFYFPLYIYISSSSSFQGFSRLGRFPIHSHYPATPRSNLTTVRPLHILGQRTRRLRGREGEMSPIFQANDTFEVLVPYQRTLMTQALPAQYDTKPRYGRGRHSICELPLPLVFSTFQGVDVGIAPGSSRWLSEQVNHYVTEAI